MGVPAAYRPRGAAWLYRAYDGLIQALGNIGHFLPFAYYAVRYAPQAMWKFRGQTIRTVTDLAWGRGAIIVGGGTALVMAVLGLAPAPPSRSSPTARSACSTSDRCRAASRPMPSRASSHRCSPPSGSPCRPVAA